MKYIMHYTYLRDMYWMGVDDIENVYISELSLENYEDKRHKPIYTSQNFWYGTEKNGTDEILTA